jgi:glyoxylase-like metal-dependent hydrolase (beta-lactamase superfamily II)
MEINRRHMLAGAAVLSLAGRRARAQQPAAALTTLRDVGFSLPIHMASAGRDPAEVRALLQAAGHPVDALASVLNVSVLRRADGVMLFDCGAGRNFMPGTGLLPDALAQSGVQPEEVRHVLFTHAHPDHLWGALDDFDTPAFPNATHHLAAAEWDDWFAPDIYQRLPEDRHAFAAGARRVLKILEPTLKRFRPGDEPVAGVLAVEAGGHTAGHTAFQVMADGEPTLIAGDAATHPIISFERPDWPGGFDADGERAARTRRALLDRAAADRLRIVGYHLPRGGVGQVERKGAAFRFVQA